MSTCTCRVPRKDVRLGAEAIAAAMGEADSAAGQRKPGKVKLTAERLSCVYHLVKAKCGMTQAQHACMVAALECWPASDSTCEVTCCQMQLSRHACITCCHQCEVA